MYTRCISHWHRILKPTRYMQTEGSQRLCLSLFLSLLFRGSKAGQEQVPTSKESKRVRRACRRGISNHYHRSCGYVCVPYVGATTFYLRLLPHCFTFYRAATAWDRRPRRMSQNPFVINVARWISLEFRFRGSVTPCSGLGLTSWDIDWSLLSGTLMIAIMCSSF